MSEEWRDVVGYEGYYQVSNIGRVRSLDRIDSHNQPRKGIILKPRTSIGYHRVELHKDDGGKHYGIHRLVLLSFVGYNKEKPLVCHNNGIRNDNRLENLRWDTHSGNEADKRLHGTSIDGSRAALSKLKEEDVLKIRSMYNEGFSISNLSNAFNVTRTNIYYIIKRKTWKHI